MFTRSSIIDDDHLRVITYINIKLAKLYFSLRKNISNHQDIKLIFFFNYGILCFIINIYSDNQQSILKYLKNTEANLNNILSIMISNFNIRDNNLNLSYYHHLIHSDILCKVADSLDLDLSIPINPVPTQYTDNPQDLNSVIDLIFLCTKTEEFNNYHISPDLKAFLIMHVYWYQLSSKRKLFKK